MPPTETLASRSCSFLTQGAVASSIFTAEDLSQEHLAVARTTDKLWVSEVEPNLEAIRRQEPGVARGVMRKAAEPGLTAVRIPERFGGMELDLALYFDNEEQKQRYLPKPVNAVRIRARIAERFLGREAYGL